MMTKSSNFDFEIYEFHVSAIHVYIYDVLNIPLCFKEKWRKLLHLLGLFCTVVARWRRTRCVSYNVLTDLNDGILAIPF